MTEKRYPQIAGYLVFTLTAILFPVKTPAHHSFFAEFSSEWGEIEGQVTEVFYKNPHAHFYIKVINEAGEEEIWDAHAQNLRIMTRVGWKVNTVQVGERLRVRGNLGRDGHRKIAVIEAILSDGTVIHPFPGNTAGFVNTFDESQVDDRVRSREDGEKDASVQ